MFFFGHRVTAVTAVKLRDSPRQRKVVFAALEANILFALVADVVRVDVVVNAANLGVDEWCLNVTVVGVLSLVPPLCFFPAFFIV